MSDKIFGLFIRHRRYVNNYSENTIRTYKLAWKIWKRLMGDEEFSKPSCNEFVAKMRESGITPQSANVHIKAINGFLIFRHENEYIPELYHIKHVKAPFKVIKPVPDEVIRKIVSWRPKRKAEHRLYALLLCLIDTGVRIDEALSLRRDCVDLDNLILKVRGKGDKERLVPFSFEYRKVLFKYLQRHSYSLVFATNNGNKWTYGNCWRDVQNLLSKLGAENYGCHAFRHSFASNYLRFGGNLLYLSKQLGHVNVNTTKRDVTITTEDLQKEQARLSPLARLR